MVAEVDGGPCLFCATCGAWCTIKPRNLTVRCSRRLGSLLSSVFGKATSPTLVTCGGGACMGCSRCMWELGIFGARFRFQSAPGSTLGMLLSATLRWRSRATWGNGALGPWDQLHQESPPHAGAATARRLCASDTVLLCVWLVQKPRSRINCTLALVTP